MKIILVKNVPKVGKKDEVVTVPDGYAQNALLPKKLAIIATDHAIAALQRTHQNKITEKKIQHELLDKAIEGLEGPPALTGEQAGKTLIYETRKNEKGSLFSKVTEHDISKALMTQHRISIDAKLLTLKDGAIKQTGSYTVEVKDGEYCSEFKVQVK